MFFSYNFSLSAAVGTDTERGVSSAGGAVEEEVDVDENLFLEEVDDSEEEEEGGGTTGHAQVGVASDDAAAMAVDESLFDVDNLQDLNLDDPAILEPHGQS